MRCAQCVGHEVDSLMRPNKQKTFMLHYFRLPCLVLAFHLLLIIRQLGVSIVIAQRNHLFIFISRLSLYFTIIFCLCFVVSPCRCEKERAHFNLVRFVLVVFQYTFVSFLLLLRIIASLFIGAIP